MVGRRGDDCRNRAPARAFSRAHSRQRLSRNGRTGRQQSVSVSSGIEVMRRLVFASMTASVPALSDPKHRRPGAVRQLAQRQSGHQANRDGRRRPS